MSLFSRNSTKGQNNDAARRRHQPSDQSAEQRSASGRSFKRNTTLTGSSSGKITSSAELNARFVSPRAHTHNLSATRRKLAGLFVVVAFVAGGLYILLTQLVANVEVRIAGADPLSSSEQATYQKTVNDYYAARPAERVRLLLNQQAFLSHIQASHPEVEKAKLLPRGVLGNAVLRLQARSAIARWDIASDNTYVDDSGVVFTKNYYTTPKLRIVDNSGVRIGGDKVLASNRFLGFIGRVAGLAESRGLSITQVTIPAQSTRQVEVRAKKGGGAQRRFILSIDRSVGEQAEDMARIDAYLTHKELKPAYIDIRVKGKAFYK